MWGTLNQPIFHRNLGLLWLWKGQSTEGSWFFCLWVMTFLIPAKRFSFTVHFADFAVPPLLVMAANILPSTRDANGSSMLVLAVVQVADLVRHRRQTIHAEPWALSSELRTANPVTMERYENINSFLPGMAPKPGAAHRFSTFKAFQSDRVTARSENLGVVALTEKMGNPAIVVEHVDGPVRNRITGLSEGHPKSPK